MGKKKGHEKKKGHVEDDEDCGIPNKCSRVVPRWLVALDNGPTITMFFIGAAMLWLIWWPLSILFLAYAFGSIVLFWAIICPYCNHFDTRACPCGYGVMAPRLFKAKTGDFQAIFKRNLSIMYPDWAIPFIAGVYLLWKDYSMLAVVLFAAFCAIGFAFIPAVSFLVGCNECEIKDECPWMGGKAKPKKRVKSSRSDA